jgi:hypothetical protein
VPGLVWVPLLVGAGWFVWWLVHREGWLHLNPWLRWTVSIPTGVVVMYAGALLLALVFGW